jgi:hypothetical protein
VQVKKKKCKFCGGKYMPSTTTQKACGLVCAIALAEKQRVGEQKAAKVATKKEKTRELRTRREWYAMLQVLVNQYVRWRDRDEGCCTCGTLNPNIKYDAGHFHTTAARPDIRFELTQIHKQCSQKCNVWGSGKRNEYEKFIIEKYGQDHVEWLEQIKPSLKEIFPNWQDIEIEIKRYRELLRSVGVKPNI